jgi:fructose-1,6-bisphosphatase/inositol monophosphatase family enzyme
MRDIRERQSDPELALAAAAAGVAVLRRLYQQPVDRYDKSTVDFATQADLEAEDAVRTVVSGARPDDSFVGEEGGETTREGAVRRWLVDPLCGTLNYAAGTPLAALNIALVTAEGVAAAVSADPISEEFFWADDQAAHVRRAGIDASIRPSAQSRLVDINCDGQSARIGSLLIADPDLREHFGPRVLSTTLALAWVADGRRAGYVTDGNLEDSVHFTAGVALCRAAGCVVTDLAGGPLYSRPGLVAAADVATSELLLHVVARHR